MRLRPAVFLDRDGTIIEDRHYLADPEGVRLLPGAAGAVARLNAAGWFACLVTNQSGIGRGLFTEAEYRAVHERMVADLAAGGARLDAAYHSPLAPHDPDPGATRKPGPGLFLRAAREHGLDLACSAFVGDRVRDVAVAAEVGGRALLVRGPQSELDRLPPGVEVVGSLAEAVERIVGGVAPG